MIHYLSMNYPMFRLLLSFSRNFASRFTLFYFRDFDLESPGRFSRLSRHFHFAIYFILRNETKLITVIFPEN
jgi:hypothetical protein